MARVSTYINTLGRTEEAFRFYAQVFGTSITSLHRFSDGPDGGAELSVEERDKVIHVELPILGGHILMGTDMLASLGHVVEVGNNVSINLEPDSREEADALHARLSVDSAMDTGLHDMPWGAYWCNIVDQFGVQWQINVPS